MAWRWGAEASALPRETERYVVASTSLFSLTSTRRELARRKSAPSRGRDTSAIVKSHWYVLEARRSCMVRVPYVLIVLPLAAMSVGPD